MGYVFQINISKGGVPKLSITEAQVGELGIMGDKQKDRRYHGGLDRALCLFSLEEIEKLKQEGHPIYPGSTGENLTISLQGYSQLQTGDVLKIGGEVVIEITSYTAPCKTIQDSFVDHKFKRMSQKLFPGSSRLYAKVLVTGKIRQGDKIEKVQ